MARLPADLFLFWALGAASTTPSMPSSGAPTAFLAKELELCYAVVAIVGTAAGPLGNALIAAISNTYQNNAPATIMQPARERGLASEDWRGWIGEINGSYTKK